MGRIHAKHLSEIGVPWDYHDPFIAGGVGLDRLADYTHAIIATPIPTHYRQLEEFPGRILIEKPVVVRPEHLQVLDDERVFAGMCERFNPVVEALKASVRPEDIISLEFCRTSLTGHVADVGIHDLDLYCHLLELRDVPDWCWEGDTLVAKANGVKGRFHWPTSVERQRTITVTTAEGKLATDLLGQRIDAQKLSVCWPVKKELRAFLEGELTEASVSHSWLTEIVIGRLTGFLEKMLGTRQDSANSLGVRFPPLTRPSGKPLGLVLLHARESERVSEPPKQRQFPQPVAARFGDHKPHLRLAVSLGLITRRGPRPPISATVSARDRVVYNVTGESTWDWMKWAAETGRGAAIGAGTAQFQTLVGYDRQTGTYYVCNNNSPQRIDSYDEAAFRRLHLASGQWVVILDYPPHPERPQYVPWW